MGVWGGLGLPPHMCTCTHMHARTCALGKHDNFMQMAASIGFLGNPWEFPMMSYGHMRMHVCMCMHVHACACVWGHPLTTLHPHPPPPTDPSMGGGMSTNHKSSNRIELSRLGQDLYNC